MSDHKIDEDVLRAIEHYLIDNIFRNPDIMFNDEIQKYDMPELIASLFEVLHRAVKDGEHYEYMFHWANKIGSWVTDDLFTNYEFMHEVERDEEN